jgi:hypothetical protein
VSLLVAVLLPVIILLLAQYHALAGLEGKTRTAVHENLRQTLQSFARRVVEKAEALAASAFHVQSIISTGLVHETKGSGLGLAIVKHIVEAHRGRVTVESAPGKGSRFTILLPVVRSEAADAMAERPNPGAGGESVVENPHY